MSGSSRTLVLLGFIGVIVIGVALIILPLLPQPTATPLPPTAPPQRLDEGPAPEVPRVSLDDAYNAYTTQQAIFVDVRSAEQYAASHVVGAKSLPLDEVESRLAELDPEKWIITYCT